MIIVLKSFISVEQNATKWSGTDHTVFYSSSGGADDRCAFTQAVAENKRQRKSHAEESDLDESWITGTARSSDVTALAAVEGLVLFRTLSGRPAHVRSGHSCHQRHVPSGPRSVRERRWVHISIFSKLIVINANIILIG